MNRKYPHHHHSCPPPQCFKNLAEEWNASVDLDESTGSLIHNKLCSVRISVSTAPMKAFCDHRAKQQPTCRRATLQLSIPTFIYFIWVLPEAQQSVFTGWFCCKIRWNCRGKLQEPVSDQLPPTSRRESGSFAVVGFRVDPVWGRIPLVLICELLIVNACLELY